MGILDGIVEWIAEQIMAGLDLVTTSVLGALGCDMTVFLRYFPAAETVSYTHLDVYKRQAAARAVSVMGTEGNNGLPGKIPL